MKKIVALLAVAAATASAFGQGAPVFNGTTRFTTEISTDLGLTWTSGAVTASTNTAGATIRVLARTKVSYVPGTSDNYGFTLMSSSRHQPQATGLIAADAAVAGFNPTALRVPNFANGFTPATDLGRVFGAGTVAAIIAQRPSPASLHFAEAVAALAPGTGSGNNNQTGSNGINCAAASLSGDNGVVAGVTLFYYGLDLIAPSVVNTSRTVGMDVPAAGVGLRGTAPNQFRGVAFGFNYNPFTDEDGDGIDDLPTTQLFTYNAPLTDRKSVV